MTHTDYTSLTAMITAIEAQINSLKTIIAVMANQKTEKKSSVRTPTVESDDYLMSDDEERDFSVLMEKARKEELARMQIEAEKYYVKEMNTIIEVVNERE